MRQRGVLIFFVLSGIAHRAKATRKKNFVPGPGCGTVNTIKILDGNPTLAEEDKGCYIRENHPKHFRGSIPRAGRCG